MAIYLTVPFKCNDSDLKRACPRPKGPQKKKEPYPSGISYFFFKRGPKKKRTLPFALASQSKRHKVLFFKRGPPFLLLFLSNKNKNGRGSDYFHNIVF